MFGLFRNLVGRQEEADGDEPQAESAAVAEEAVEEKVEERPRKVVELNLDGVDFGQTLHIDLIAHILRKPPSLSLFLFFSFFSFLR